jgi:hypothetical protein
VVEKIVLKFILEEIGFKMWAGLSWLRIEIWWAF